MPKTDLQRLEEKYERDETTACWIWKASTSPGPKSGKWAYGILYFKGRMCMAHRVAYELYRGPIPEGRQLDHLCRNTLCINPWHLDPVSAEENINRGRRFESEKTHCPEGHPLAGENLYLKKNGWRECRICRREQYRRWVTGNRERRRELDREFHRRKNDGT